MNSKVVLIVPKEYSYRNNNSRENIVKTDIEYIKSFKGNIFRAKQFHENIGVESIAAYLKRKHVDVQVYHNDYEEIDYYELLENPPTLIGISVLYNLHINGMIEILGNLNKYNYKGIIMLGGAFASLAAISILRCFPEVSCVCYGEGESITYELVRKLERNQEWRNLAGIIVADQKKFKFRPQQLISNLDELPYIERNVINKMQTEKYTMRVAAIYSSRGCAGKCKYCSVPNLNKFSPKKWRARSAEHLVNEMSELNKKYGIYYFYFCDDNFFGYGEMGRKRLDEIANLIIERNMKIRFHAEVRVDSKVSDNLLLKIKKAGLRDVLLGIESGAQSVLDRWKKGTTVEENIKTIFRLKKLGFNIEASMILLDADMTKAEFRKTVAFIKNTNIYISENPLNLFNKLIVFEGTEIYEEYRKRNLLVDQEINDSNSMKEKGRYLYEYDYIILDKDMEHMWNILASTINKLRYYVTNIIPERITEMFQQYKVYKNEIMKIKKWRKNLGYLCMDLLETSSVWLESECKRDLQEQLDRCISVYNEKYV